MIGVYIFLVCIFLAVAVYLFVRVVEEPNLIFVQKSGTIEEKPRESGIYYHIPYFHEIHPLDMTKRMIKIDDEVMYVNTKTSIVVKVGVWFKVENPKEAMYIKDIETRIRQVVLSNLRAEVGKMSFENLLISKGDLESRLTKDSYKGTKDPSGNFDLDSGVESFGYKILRVEIYDLEEQIESEAKRIETLGKAQASVDEGRKNAVKDITLPGAIAFSAGEISREVGKALTGFLKSQSKKGSKKGEKE